jgi:hypothetical protein
MKNDVLEEAAPYIYSAYLRNLHTVDCSVAQLLGTVEALMQQCVLGEDGVSKTVSLAILRQSRKREGHVKVRS